MNDNEMPSAPERVEKTGIVLVHENDEIYPAKGSEALLRRLGPAVVNYHFPVEIEVIAGGKEAIIEQICDELRMHIESMVI
jgi:hypothetical protein